jgi:hypothetical protein
MNPKSLLILIGSSIVIIVILMKIFAFFSIGEDVYGFYLAFFVFIVLSIIILPNHYQELT